MCTYNNSSDVYDSKVFVEVVLFTILVMAVGDLFLALLFEYIISAPATSSSPHDVQDVVAKENLRLKYHKKVQAQLSRLNKYVQAYVLLLID